MRLDAFKSLDEMSEKDLLKIVIANQLNIIYRIERLEKEIKPKDAVNFELTIKDTIGKIESYESKISKYIESQSEL